MANELGQSDSASQDARSSRRFSEELVEEARSLFQAQTERNLTPEDGRQILENLVGFFSILHEWERAARHPATKAVPIDNDAHCDIIDLKEANGADHGRQSSGS